jgi:hypothetical protein
VFVAIIVAFAIALSLSWIVFALCSAALLGIPAQRRILGRLRENAYPDGPPAE